MSARHPQLPRPSMGDLERAADFLELVGNAAMETPTPALVRIVCTLDVALLAYAKAMRRLPPP